MRAVGAWLLAQSNLQIHLIMTNASLPCWIVFLSIIFCSYTPAAALVVSAPGIGIDSFIDTRQQVNIGAQPLVLRIRSTREDDLPEIASLLASASITEQELQWNWKTSMQVLRTKAAMQSLLASRYQAIREGKRVAERVPLDEEITTSDEIKLLWSHDVFRRKLEKAASQAKEPHIWKDCDFAVAPRDPKALQHAMITAEDITTGSIVGFCEVAMLALPYSCQNEFTSIASAPTIANLVSSTKHRRRGIASSLLKSTKKYVQRQWSGDAIALYVDSANKRAISLYSKHGFIAKDLNEAHGSELYMQKSLNTENARELVRV